MEERDHGERLKVATGSASGVTEASPLARNLGKGA